MSDRTTASLFSRIFEHLANTATAEDKKFAEELYQETNSYDFSDYQMGCDDALIILGLARVEVNEEGEEIITYKRNW